MASTISTRSSVERKNVQRCAISCKRGNSPRASAADRASPTPSHAGSMLRFWVHAKTHGIARKLSIP
ncbi:MAG: hypothetical protein R3B70_32470 [Polyangiaceae bacterium]